MRGRKEIDFPYKVENNIYFLYPFPVHLFRRMDYDFLDKFIDDCRGEFLYPHILADNRGEAVKIAFVLFVGIDFLLICLDLFFQFPLFRFILCGQLQKPVMAYHAAYVVLINPFEDTLKFRYPFFRLFDFTLPALHFLFCFSGALLIHNFMESSKFIFYEAVRA